MVLNAIQEKNMVATDRITELFEDARALRLSALEQYGQGDVRDAAEKAWCATRRATDALVLAVTGEEPQTSTQTSTGIRRLAYQHADARHLRIHFNACAKELHSECFYDGQCEPVETVLERIEETAQYIADAERLAMEAGEQV